MSHSAILNTREGDCRGAFEYLLNREEADLLKTLQRARAYISARARNCQKSITSSSSQQQVSDTIREMLKQLVTDSDGSGEACVTARKMLETVWSEVGFDLRIAYVMNRCRRFARRRQEFSVDGKAVGADRKRRRFLRNTRASRLEDAFIGMSKACGT